MRRLLGTNFRHDRSFVILTHSTSKAVQRDLAALTNTPFDTVVIGGGVLGACIARDAALRDLRVALIEKRDFASGTSSNSLKIVHGGLRYLQHLGFRRMRESIRERSTWLRIAPHLVTPLPVVMPIYKRSFQSRAVLQAAFAVNDAVAWDRNQHLHPERCLPRGRILSRQECLEFVPQLEGRNLTAGALFYDAQMYSSERLVLEVLEGAHRAGAVVANYVEFKGPLMLRDRLNGIRARDAITGDEFDIRAKLVINAAGPNAPEVAAQLNHRLEVAATSYSIAVNLMVPALGHKVAFALPGASRSPTTGPGARTRQLFFVPWRGRSLIGTGHLPYNGDPNNFSLEDHDLEIFLHEVNLAWPGTPIMASDVVLVHSGLLPLATDGSAPNIHLLKRHKVIDHAAYGAGEVITAISVKFTTARLVAQRVVDLACRKLGKDGRRCRTAVTLLPGAPTDSPDALLLTARRRYGDALELDVLEHLVHTYGVAYEQIIGQRNSMLGWNERLMASAPVIRAQLLYGVQEEMACSPEDLLCRRTEIGARGMVWRDAVDYASKVLRGELHATAERDSAM